MPAGDVMRQCRVRGTVPVGVAAALAVALAVVLAAALLAPAQAALVDGPGRADGPHPVAVAPAGGAPGAPAAGQWLAGDLHVHTTYSHDSYGGPGDDNTGPGEAHTFGWSVGQQFAHAAARGLDYLAITDHNDVRSQTDPGFGSGGVIGVPGYEKSLRGHAQMLGARRVYDDGKQSVRDVERVARELRLDGGVFQVNHPAEGYAEPGELEPDLLDWDYGYEVRPDTVEVWNISRLWQPPLPSASSNDDAIRYWEGWLDRGERVAATGGSDNHWVSTFAVQGVGQPTTWVFAETATAEGVLEGLRRGRTFVSHQPPALGGPRLFLEGDPGDDGVFEAMVGDTVPAGSTLRVRADGLTGAGLVRVVTDGGREAFDPVPVAGGIASHSFTLPPDATWVRAELLAPDGVDARRAACDDLFGSDTTYCRNQLLTLALTSALFLACPGDAGSPPPPSSLVRTCAAPGGP